MRSEAKADAARIREEAEEHARRLVLDARATADGVRAEGMEVVSNLRQISETLRVLAERVFEDVEAIHARMVEELEGAGQVAEVSEASPVGEVSEVSPEGEVSEVSPEGDELDVPDFLARG